MKGLGGFGHTNQSEDAVPALALNTNHKNEKKNFLLTAFGKLPAPRQPGWEPQADSNNQTDDNHACLNSCPLFSAQRSAHRTFRLAWAVVRLGGTVRSRPGGCRGKFNGLYNRAGSGWIDAFAFRWHGHGPKLWNF